MNTEGLSEVAVKDAHPVVEQVTETPPELEPAAACGGGRNRLRRPRWRR